jgi:hypothetical protein
MNGRSNNPRGVPALGAFGLLFAAGAAPVLTIPAQVFGLLPVTESARWVVLPLALTAAWLMAGRGAYGGWARYGFVAGLLAVGGYDAVRLPMVVLGWWPDFIPRLGGWILGTGKPNAIVGYAWRYLGDGGGIGLAFFVTCGVLATVRPGLVRRYPVGLAVGYGIFVWSGLVATIAFSVRGASMLFALTPTSLALSLLGHLIYGGVLGACLRRAVRHPVPTGRARRADVASHRRTASLLGVSDRPPRAARPEGTDVPGQGSR